MNPSMAGEKGFDQYGRCNGVMPPPSLPTTSPDWEGLIESARTCLRKGERFELPAWAVKLAKREGLDVEECRLGVVVEAYQRSVEDLIERMSDPPRDLF